MKPIMLFQVCKTAWTMWLLKHIREATSCGRRTWIARVGVLVLGTCVVLTGSCADSAAEAVRHKNAGDEAYVRRNYSVAEREYQAALKKAERAGPNDVITMICLRSLAQVYVAQRRAAEAEAIYKKRVELLTQSHKDPAYSSTVYDDLATFYILGGRVAEAKPLYQQAIALTELAYGSEDPELTEKLEYYVGLLRAKDYEAEALELQKRLDSRKL